MRKVALSLALLVPLVLAHSEPVTAQAPKSGRAPAMATDRRDAPFQRIEELDQVKAWRGSKLIGSTVKDAEGKDIGKIEDLLVDRNGRITHGVLSFGGMLGIGERHYAVPWSAIRAQRDDRGNLTAMVANVKKETLEGAPRYAEEPVAPTSGAEAMKTEGRSDSAISAAVKSRLAREKLGTLTKIDVDTENGVVHLKGSVESESMKRRAAELARQVEGVREVRNDLRVGG